MRTRSDSAKAFLFAMLPCLLLGSPVLGAFRAAVAVRDVTPEKLLPVSGGVGASQPVTRKIGQLTVRALVLENDGTRVALCSTDFLGFPAVLGNKVRARVQGIPPQNILIGATHCHSAPDCYGFPDRSGKTGADLAYLDERLREAGGGNQRGRGSPATGTGENRHRQGPGQDRLQLLRREAVRPALLRHPSPEPCRRARRHTHQLRLSPGGHRAGSGHPVPGFRRPAV